ncbi:MAG TPA: CehA/McbA family metallohydrolase [Candidatus Brocadiia bacterium]|nr:CehA/McbA family metallohydrolase [Candidatus Brocadiia bacterium]
MQELPRDPVIVNPFDVEGEWLKANLHTHTTVSDGSVPPQERIGQYAREGYRVLALTDHNAVVDVDALDPMGMILIRGVETTAQTADKFAYYHIVNLNVPQDFNPKNQNTIEEQIKLTTDAGGMVILGHPYWCGLTIREMEPVRGIVAFEVENSTCRNIGKGTSSVHWDDMLAAGRMLPAVAVDDVHGDRDLYGAWTMLKAKSPDLAGAIEAIRTGCYYASCGPVIQYVGLRDGKLLIECSPAREIRIMSRHSTGRWVKADCCDSLTRYECEPRGDWPYVRIEIVDAQGRRAWTNPLIMPKKG